MDQVFASPAKRQKVCADPCNDSGVCSSIQAGGSRLKGSTGQHSSTPHKPKQQQQQQGEPHTPGSKAPRSSSGADDGLLHPSPQPLAPNLMVLNQILGALYVTLPMVRGRSKATTYLNLRAPVQNFCGRDFQVKHVQQIKALCPQALGWSHILAFNPATKRQEQQLCLTMPTDADNPKQPADTTALQQLFYQRLQQHQAAAAAADGSKAVELPLAELPPAAGPSARDCTPSRQRTTSGSLLPATPQTAPPAANSSGSSASAAQLVLSPPPKRHLATTSRAQGAGGLMMSPPPARARGGRRLAGDDAFAFSPAPRQPELLLSPRRGGGGSGSGGAFATPDKAPSGAAAAAAAAAEGGAATGGLTPSLRPNRLFGTPLAAATPEQSSAARPSTHYATPEPAAEGSRAPAAAAAAAAAAGPSGVKVRKLTFDGAAPRRHASKAPAAAAAAAEQPGEAATAPVPGSDKTGGAPGARPSSKSKSGITFELGASAMALLRQVSRPEAKQEAAAQAEALDQARALDMLPGSFEALRAVFGERGPCVKPKAEVVQLLRQKSTHKGGMSPADAAEQLDLMARLVPQFVRLVTTPGVSLAAVTHSVRISRHLPWPAARQSLLAAAGEARGAGCAAAAAAVEQDQQREQQEAAAADAAAQLDGDEEEDEEESEEEQGSGSEGRGAAAAAAASGAAVLDELGLDAAPGSGGSKAAPAADILALLGGGGGGGADVCAALLCIKAPPPSAARRTSSRRQAAA